MNALLLSIVLAFPPTEEVTERWPDGGTHCSKTIDGKVLLKETCFFTTGARWSETTWSDGGIHRTWDTRGWLADVKRVNRAGNADGPARHYQRDGGLLAAGDFADGREVGVWKAWYESGQVEYERFYAPAGVLSWEVTWTSEGWKQQEFRNGARTEFTPDGGVESHCTKTGRVDSYRDGRLVQQDQLTDDGPLLLNAWGADGGFEIRNGTGSRMQTDGELGFQYRQQYRGGKPVRPR